MTRLIPMIALCIFLAACSVSKAIFGDGWNCIDGPGYLVTIHKPGLFGGIKSWHTTSYSEENGCVTFVADGTHDDRTQRTVCGSFEISQCYRTR